MTKVDTKKDVKVSASVMFIQAHSVFIVSFLLA
jgi:hypothetical protein